MKTLNHKDTCKDCRRPLKVSRGQKTTDGAGVHLTRVLSRGTAYDFDPFLMLDSFDSENPDDYTAGFPMHPHRGIETMTYLIKGEIDHEDSLGNKGTITDGQSQWMTSGSGILHQEMPKACQRMLGLQLWINLPKKEKMTHPQYFDITDEMVGKYENEDMAVRVISGEYKGMCGVKPHHVQATILDFDLQAGKSVDIEVNEGENAFIFLVEGSAETGGQVFEEKSAVLFSMEGSHINVSALNNKPSRFMFFSALPLNESIAWAGPIVMNTDKELEQAFTDLNTGNFIKENAL